MRKGMIKNQAGVTLTELMVVIGIIAISAAIAAPMFTSNLPHKRLKNAARELMTDLRNARSLAVSNNTPYFLCYISDTTYQIDKVDDTGASDCASANTPTEKSVNLEDQYHGVEFGYKSGVSSCPDGGTGASDAFKFTGDRVTFNSHGAAVDGPLSTTLEVGGAVYLTNTEDSDQETYCIEVEGSTGRPKVYKWDSGSSTWKS